MDANSIIEKFIVQYPQPNDYKKLYELDEFDITLTDIPLKVKDSNLLDHQLFVARFFNKYTPYKTGLVWYGLGTGKTCIISAIAENFARTVKSPNTPPAIVLVPNSVLAANFKREVLYVCAKNKYFPKDVTEYQINKILDASYEIRTHDKGISDLYDLYTTNNAFFKLKYSHRVFLIDEAHNISEQDTNQTNTYSQLRVILKAIESPRVVLFTGTPIRDQPFSFASLINILFFAEQSEPFPTFSKFEINEQQLKSKLKGKIFYLRSVESDCKVKYIGSVLPGFKKVILYPSTASDFQQQKCINVSPEIQKDSSFFQVERRHANFVYPSENVEYIIDQNKIYKFNPSTDIEREIKSNLSKYSAKFSSIIKLLEASPKELAYIYFDDFVNGPGGAIQFGMILKLFGWEQITAAVNSPGQKRFVVVTSDDHTTSESKPIQNIINTFNDPKNKYGDYIRLFIGSKSTSEGISLFCVRQAHIVSSPWNFPTIDQAKGRFLRYKSHINLQPEERYVNIYQHVLIYDNNTNKEPIDIHIYKLAEDKDISSAKIRKILKQIAVDCNVNKIRNVLSGDVKGSRICDYDDCDITCDEKKTDIHSDTNYNLLYAEDEIDLVTHKLIKYFGENPHGTFERLVGVCNTSRMILFFALNKLIQTKIPIQIWDGRLMYLMNYTDNFYLCEISQPQHDKYEMFSYLFPIVIEQKFTLSDMVIQNVIEREQKLILKSTNIDHIWERLSKYSRGYVYEINVNMNSNSVFKKNNDMSYFVGKCLTDKINELTSGRAFKTRYGLVHTYFVENNSGTEYAPNALPNNTYQKIRIFVNITDYTQEPLYEWRWLTDVDIESMIINEIRNASSKLTIECIGKTTGGICGITFEGGEDIQRLLFKEKRDVRGRECSKLPMNVIHEILHRIKYYGIVPDKLKSVSRADCIAAIRNLNIKNTSIYVKKPKIFDEYTDDELRGLYNLLSQKTKEIICNHIWWVLAKEGEIING